MSLDPAVRIVMEGTGEVIVKLPPFSSLPSEGDEIELAFDGTPSVVYKVEKVRFVAQVIEQDTPVTPAVYGVQCWCNVIVSEA